MIYFMKKQKVDIDIEVYYKKTLLKKRVFLYKNYGIPSWNRTSVYPLGGGYSIHWTIGTLKKPLDCI